MIIIVINLFLFFFGFVNLGSYILCDGTTCDSRGTPSSRQPDAGWGPRTVPSIVQDVSRRPARTDPTGFVLSEDLVNSGRILLKAKCEGEGRWR